jgi:hypothetical protein
VSAPIIDPHSDTWRAVKAWADERVKALDRELRTVGLPIDKTEGNRYAIRELESLLKLPNPSRMPQLPASSDPSL